MTAEEKGAVNSALVYEMHEFASKIAIEAGICTLQYFRKNIDIEWKKDRSPVTIADRETEIFIRRKIIDRYPAHSVMGEEFGMESHGEAAIQWIIDPIDGTRSFIHGIPLYTVLIAVMIDNVPVAGVIHNPPLNETVSAGTGIGCYYNNARCTVSTTANLSDAVVQITDFTHMSLLRPGFTMNIASRCASCRGWGDGYGYLLVATGRSDIMVDPVMNIWDIAPLLPVIKEAGGRISDFNGIENSPGENSIATNGFLHDQVMRLVNEI